MKKISSLLCLFAAFFLVTAFFSEGSVTPQQVIQNYARLVHANYQDAYRDAKQLQDAIANFLDNPNDATLRSAKSVWLSARHSYSQTEAFRFYEGPIDFVDIASGKAGPEGRLNAWPLNESYIDYVAGNQTAGIVQDASVTITPEFLRKKNQALDESDVSTGYHAIEFLLWGQDLNIDGAGSRPASDYDDTPENARRREYLRAVTTLLVDDLSFLVESWEPEKDNYAATFVALPPRQAMARIMTSLATLSGFELAAERMGTALDSGDQEDEQSCFSDNTHNDFINNVKGIRNVYYGHYHLVNGASIHALLHEKNPELAQVVATQLDETTRLVKSIPQPFDREVLATKPGSEGRKIVEETIASLQQQADLFKKAGKELGVEVEILQ